MQTGPKLNSSSRLFTQLLPSSKELHHLTEPTWFTKIQGLNTQPNFQSPFPSLRWTFQVDSMSSASLGSTPSSLSLLLLLWIRFIPSHLDVWTSLWAGITAPEVLLQTSDPKRPHDSFPKRETWLYNFPASSTSVDPNWVWDCVCAFVCLREIKWGWEKKRRR